MSECHDKNKILMILKLGSSTHIPLAPTTFFFARIFPESNFTSVNVRGPGLADFRRFLVTIKQWLHMVIVNAYQGVHTKLNEPKN